MDEPPEPQPISIASALLSPRAQMLAGPIATGVMIAGYLCFRLAAVLGLPRPELFALIGLGIGVSAASLAITLGVVLLVAKQAPRRTLALVSMVLGIVAFLLAGPLFLLIAAM